MKYEKSELESAYESLRSLESFIEVVFGSLFGIVIGSIVFWATGRLLGHSPVYIFPFGVGLGVKYIGHVFTLKYRALAGFFGAISFLGSLLFFSQAQWFVILTPIAFAITYYLAKVEMSDVERHAVWKKGLK